jgi:hypothetical protein
MGRADAQERPVSEALVTWSLEANEPWTRYRALADLLDRPEDDRQVQEARAVMLAHPQVQALIAAASAWPGYPLKRHNDAAHPLYALSTLADFGLRADDPGVGAIVEAVTANQSSEGAFQTQLQIGRAYGGGDEPLLSWMSCDAPTLLYALLSFGLGYDLRVQRAADYLAGLAGDVGWRCQSAPELGGFRGPGRRDDPCPVANVYALKALSLAPDYLDSPATRAGAEMLLWHWAHQRERKLYLFGIGTDFRKLKYPYVWYDILHVLEVLSRFRFVRDDPRYGEMLSTLAGQADEAGRYTAGSMYRAWKGWSFANKTQPSPWLTLLARRIAQRSKGCGPRPGATTRSSEGRRP